MCKIETCTCHHMYFAWLYKLTTDLQIYKAVTVLFSDVRGFTAISERLQDRPQDLTRLMNRLLTPLTAQIMENNGTIDKFMGDGIMATIVRIKFQYALLYYLKYCVQVDHK